MKKVLSVLALLLFLPVLSTQAFASSSYTVKGGDTLWKISNTHGVSLNDLRKANNKWDDMIYIGQTLTIPDGTTTVTNNTVNNTTTSGVTASEKDLLARLVRAEAESEPYAGKVAVATVVFNRVASKDFPNTISGVINQSGQFSPVSNGAINRPADSESVRAVNEAITFRGQGAGSLFFYNPKVAKSTFLESRPTTIVIGNHVFKK